jgi:hypothetical protein
MGMSLKVGDAVWFRQGMAVRNGTIVEILGESAGIAWGLRVQPDVRTRSDGERGFALSEHSVFARPQQRERLIRSLMDDMDMLGYHAQKLADEKEDGNE